MSDLSIVEVTRADREAWIEYEDFDGAFADRVRTGSEDATEGLQAFARHRASEAERVREAGPIARLVAALIERQYQIYLRDGMEPETARSAAKTWVEEEFREFPDIAAAIRSLPIGGE